MMEEPTAVSLGMVTLMRVLVVKRGANRFLRTLIRTVVAAVKDGVPPSRARIRSWRKRNKRQNDFWEKVGGGGIQDTR